MNAINFEEIKARSIIIMLSNKVIGTGFSTQYILTWRKQKQKMEKLMDVTA
jgi:hypothetical protein